MTAPLTPPDCDLRAFRKLPLDIGRFRDSDLVTHEEPEAVLAAILLWGVAWHQVPAASLPDDDKLLAKFANYGRAVDQWMRVRDGALRGFVRCSDGRLYHKVLAEAANESWNQRLKYEWEKAKDRHRKAQRELPEAERFEFPDFDDWREHRAGPPRPQSTRQPELDLGPIDFDSPAPSAHGARAPARTERAGAHAQGTRTERVRTGASTVPDEHSDGKQETFRGNTSDIPLENSLKGEESKGKELGDSSQHTSPYEPARGNLGNADLKELYDAVCDASGFTSSSPEAISRAFGQIERWKHNGFDFEKTVIPVIKRTVAESNEITRTLARFNKAISHEHARQRARGELHKPPAPPESPILEPEGEDPMFKPIRKALLDQLGAQTYSAAANRVRFSDIGANGTTRPLRIKGPEHLIEAWTHGKYKPYLKRAAEPHGFTDIWN